MPCLLASKPQSFTPIINDNCNIENLFLVPFNTQDIIFLSGTQVIVFNSLDLSIKEEVLLDFPIESFNFDTKGSLLTIKLEINTESESDGADIFTDGTVDVTITGKTCSWSLNCPNHLLTLSFSQESSQLINCRPNSNNDTLLVQQPTTEIVKDRFLVQLLNGQLLISDKSDRKIVFSAVKVALGTINSLIWMKNGIFIFTYSEKGILRILKYPLIQFTPPTNGCNAPLVTWSNDIIHVHRAGAICPTWYKLKNNEVWDVLYSPVGNVTNVQVSVEGTCLLVCGDSGIAFCDFLKRSWQPISSFQSLINPKWLGDSHVVALTPGPHPQLILISRKSAELLAIPVPEPQAISFIDTYNNWQLLIQTPTKMDIYAFEGDNSCNFTFVKAIPLEQTDCLKQAAFFKDALYSLDTIGKLTTGSFVLCEDCESFLVLSTGHLLIHLHNQTSCLYHVDDCKMVPIGQSPLAVLPFTNCFTTLTSADLPANFSLNSALQSKFLLPVLFANSIDQESLLLKASALNDPLYPLALEYILLESLGKAEYLAVLDRVHSKDHMLIMSKAIVGLTRKIEAHEASQKLFQHLPSFSPLFITKSLPLSDLLIFLPYLAKSYFENVEERKEAIVLVLDSLFSKRRFYGHIGKVKEYLSAFADLDDLFTTVVKTKIESLWQSGRVFKAYELMSMSFADIDSLELPNSFDENNPVSRIDSLISSQTHQTHESFYSWLKTRMAPKIE